MFKRSGVFSEVELAARNEVKWEMYTKKIQIEARVLGDLAINHVIPVATRYQSILLDNVYKIKNLFDAEKCGKISAQDLHAIERISDHIATIRDEVRKMVDARKVANRIETSGKRLSPITTLSFPRWM